MKKEELDGEQENDIDESEEENGSMSTGMSILLKVIVLVKFIVLMYVGFLFVKGIFGVENGPNKVSEIETMVADEYNYKEDREYVIKDKGKRVQTTIDKRYSSFELVDIILEDDTGSIIKVFTTDGGEYDKRFLGDTVILQVGEEESYMYTEDSGALYIL